MSDTDTVLWLIAHSIGIYKICVDNFELSVYFEDGEDWGGWGGVKIQILKLIYYSFKSSKDFGVYHHLLDLVNDRTYYLSLYCKYVRLRYWLITPA